MKIDYRYNHYFLINKIINQKKKISKFKFINYIKTY